MSNQTDSHFGSDEGDDTGETSPTAGLRRDVAMPAENALGVIATLSSLAIDSQQIRLRPSGLASSKVYLKFVNKAFSILNLPKNRYSSKFSKRSSIGRRTRHRCGIQHQPISDGGAAHRGEPHEASTRHLPAFEA